MVFPQNLYFYLFLLATENLKSLGSNQILGKNSSMWIWDRHVGAGMLWVLKQVCFTGWLNKFVYRWIFPVFSKGEKVYFLSKYIHLHFFTLCSRCNVVVQVCDVCIKRYIQSNYCIWRNYWKYCLVSPSARKRADHTFWLTFSNQHSK